MYKLKDYGKVDQKCEEHLHVRLPSQTPKIRDSFLIVGNLAKPCKSFPYAPSPNVLICKL